MSKRTGDVPTLSASTYAILGLLAAGAHTAYELTRQMERTLHYFWPRAASKLYEAPKLLASMGLAQGQSERAGRRSRTRYTITAAGSEALAKWLGSPEIAPLELESEALLRVWFGAFGTIGGLRAAIEHVRQQARANLTWGRAIGQEYLTHGVPAGRGHVSVLIFRFLWDFSSMLEEWAAWSLDEVEEWQDVEPTPERMERAAAILREALAAQPEASSTGSPAAAHSGRPSSMTRARYPRARSARTASGAKAQ
jgi:PadR family transcriptional regulator, regulatory protein AphA